MNGIKKGSEGRKCIVILTLISFVLTSTFILPSLPESSAQSTAEWTILVYLDGDNTLDMMVNDDLNEMMAVGSNSDLNIIALVDRTNLDGWGELYRVPAKIYKVETGYLTELPIASAGLPTEPNMGDKSTLIKFANFGIDNYPANHYALVMWDHGGGFSSLMFDKDSTPPGTLEVHMELTDFRQGLDAIGHKFDIIGMDACSMAQLGVTYEVKEYCDYYVASEKPEPFPGWYYTPWLQAIKDDATISAEDVSKEIVSAYAAYYGGTQNTLSSIDCSITKINTLSHDMMKFAQLLEHKAGAYNTELMGALLLEEYTSGQVVGNRDLYEFADYININIADATIQAQAQLIKADINDIVVAEAGLHGTAKGMTIYFPLKYAVEYNYKPILWAQESEWDEFLDAFSENENGRVVTSPVPTITIEGTTATVNASVLCQAQIDKGRWLSGTQTTTTATHKLYVRSWNGVDFSIINETTISGVNKVVCFSPTTTFTYAFADNYNLFTLALDVDKTASQFLSESGGSILTYRDQTTGEYMQYIARFSRDTEDFPLQPGVGYWIHMPASISHTISGAKITTQTLNLDVGWNLQGYTVYGGKLKASDFAESLNGANNIVKKHGGADYLVYVEEIDSGDYYINQGEGFFVYSLTDQTVVI